jgi:hypothetical protein
MCLAEKKNIGAVAVRCLTLLGALAVPAAYADMTLSGSNPFRLKVDPAGKAQSVRVNGTGFENDGHPDRDEYMHWQVRRADGSWQRCGIRTSGCKTTGWSNNSESFEIGGDFVKREGFVELRVFRGLGLAEITEPSQAANLFSGWSNVLRVPVVNASAPPAITKLSKKEFPVRGSAKPGDYGFLIEASGLEGNGQVAVVFRGDIVVAPEAIDGGRMIRVTVPEVYRRETPGELSLTIRTDRGGNSSDVYIKFVEPPRPVMTHKGPVEPVRQGGLVPSAAEVQRTGPVAVPPPASISGGTTTGVASGGIKAIGPKLDGPALKPAAGASMPGVGLSPLPTGIKRP